MSIVDDFANIYGDFPEHERLPQVLADLKEGVRVGIIIAIYDPDGEIKYIHCEHYNGEPVVPMDQLEVSNQELLYGTPLN